MRRSNDDYWTPGSAEAGRPIYERMGYRIIANHAVFMEKRFLEGH